IAVGLSMISRAVLLLVLSGYVYAANPDQEVVVFFQLLFLQSIVISFLSASGFFRAQNLTSSDEVASFVSVYLLLIIFSLAVLSGFLFFSNHYSELKLPVSLIWFGAIFTSLSGPLSGYLLNTRGPLVAFLPSIIGAVICVIAIVFSPYEMVAIHPYLLMTTYQAVTFFILAFLSRNTIAKAIRHLRNLKLAEYLGHSRENIAIGIIHTFQMGLFFIFRENWANSVSLELAAAVFIVLRFSDAAIQFSHMVLSRHSVVSKLFSHSSNKWIGFVIFWATVCGLGLFYTSQYSTVLAPLVFALVAQLLLDMFRQFWNLSFLYQMENFLLKRYVWFAIVPPVMSYIIVLGTVGIHSPIGVYLFYLIIVLAGAVITLSQKNSP
ncbi:MAG: hypothetical protein KAT26_06415, partial [Marinosulfonomonas sp.]|nr:hypothetical protein [Marinosulfonomonas sp.]